MQVLSKSNATAGVTPPVECSSRNSMCDSTQRVNVRPSLLPVDSMEYINKILGKNRDTGNIEDGVKGGNMP